MDSNGQLDNMIEELDSIKITNNVNNNLNEYNNFVNTITNKIKSNTNLKEYIDVEINNGITIDNLINTKLQYIDTKKKEILNNLNNKKILIDTYKKQLNMNEIDRTTILKDQNIVLNNKIKTDQIELNNIEEHKIYIRNKLYNNTSQNSNELIINLLLYSIFEDMYTEKYIDQMNETILMLNKQKHQLINQKNNQQEHNKIIKEQLLNNSNYTQINKNILNLLNKLNQ